MGKAMLKGMLKRGRGQVGVGEGSRDGRWL